MLHSVSHASGLNLTNATHIFLCEPLINTAIELQAIARIHRIGQRRETTVWMYLVNDSVEESIYDISVRRRMEHMARKLKTRLGVQPVDSSVDSSEAGGEQGQTPIKSVEDMIDSANSLELQDSLSRSMIDMSEGEQVPADDLWQCLFGKINKTVPQDNRSATNEVDRVVRLNAAENRG